MSDNKELVETIANAVVKANETVNAEIVGEVKTYTALEYQELCKKNGTVWGRAKGQKTKLTAEEYIVLSNNPEWNDKSIMDKHGISADELAVVKRKVAQGK